MNTEDEAPVNLDHPRAKPDAEATAEGELHDAVDEFAQGLIDEGFPTRAMLGAFMAVAATRLAAAGGYDALARWAKALDKTSLRIKRTLDEKGRAGRRM